MDSTAPQQFPVAPATTEVQQVHGHTPVDPGESLRAASLQRRLQQIINDNEAQDIATSVSLTELRSDRNLLQHNADASHFAASVNKLPLALLLLEDLRNGTLNFEDNVTWQTTDIRGGFGVYDQPNAPTTATVRDLLFDMLNYSGNTAVRALVNYKLGGPEAVNTRLAAIPGLATTRLQVLGPNSFYIGHSTSGESLQVIKMLLGTEDEYQQFVKDALETNIFSYYGVRSQLQNSDLIVLANKPGFLDDPEGNNRHDTGIIYNTRNGKAFAYSFMTTTPSGNIAGTAQAEHSLDLLGREVLRYAGDKPSNKPVKPNTNAQQARPETRISL